MAWLEMFHAFSPKAQKAFNLCDFSGSRFSRVAECSSCSKLSDLLASLGYPLHDKGEQPPAHKGASQYFFSSRWLQSRL